MVEDAKFEEPHNQFRPMIYYIMRKLAIYKNEQEFYQIGCIALLEASQRFNEEKGNFQSYVYSYISCRMKTILTRERRIMNRECQLEKDGNLEEARESDFIPLQ